MLRVIKDEHNGRQHTILPDYIANSISEIDFKHLKKTHDIKFAAIDVDHTLVPSGGIELTDASLRFLQSQIESGTINKICLATNRLKRNLEPMAKSIDAAVVQATKTTRKPQAQFFNQVIDKLGAKPGEIAMIGDRLFVDVIGGNRAGMTTVLVERIGHKRILFNWFNMRKIEELVLRLFMKTKDI